MIVRTYNYRDKFLQLFKTLSANNNLFVRMSEVSEDSPWHREANVLVHTEMVVAEYVSLTDATASVEGREWSWEDFLGAMAVAFHDVGKPGSRIAKHSPERGDYFAYHGHELVSARLFEDFAVGLSDMFSAEDIFKVCWMIEYHMPWSTKARDKLERMSLTLKEFDMYRVYVNVLLADQRGRISDDAEANETKVREWLTVFAQMYDSVLPRVWNATAPNVYVIIAASGSGKSTLTRSLIAQAQASGKQVRKYALDDLRHAYYDIHNYANAYAQAIADPEFLTRSRAQFFEDLNWCQRTRSDLIIDNTNLSSKRRNGFIQEARKRGFNIVACLIPIQLQTILDRQHTRGDKNVPAHAVEQQYMCLQLPCIGEVDHIMFSPGMPTQ